MSDTNFGDFDPEDAYDVEDDPEMRLAVLEKVASALRAAPRDPRFSGRRTDILRVINNFIGQRTGDQARLEELKAELEAL